MKWNNLKEYKCPKCGSNLREAFNARENKIHVCGQAKKCGFVIGDDAFSRVVNGVYKTKKVKEPQDNFKRFKL